MAQSIPMAPMAIGQLLPLVQLPDAVSRLAASALTIDSREVRSGSIFVAVQGVNTHGKQYIESAIANGAVAIFIESLDGEYQVDESQAVPIIALPDLENLLSEIAGRFYGHPSRSLPVVGITGTNGKTTCSQLYAQLLALLGKRAGVIGTMGYGCCAPKWHDEHKTLMTLTSTGMTTPDAIRTQAICAELLADGCDSLVMEVSSHGLEQGRVKTIDIDAAIFTNLTHDHLDYHGDMESYGNAKAKLFAMSSIKLAVINLDDGFSSKLQSLVSEAVSVVTYSINDTTADLFLSEIKFTSSETTAVLHTPHKQYPIKTLLTGQFNLSNLLAVLGAFYSDVDTFERVVQQVEFLQPVSGRMEVVPNTLGKQVVVDYAHTPDALKNILLSVKEYVANDIWCVFGCGGDRDKAKRAVMAEIAQAHSDHVIVTSDNPRNENPLRIIDDVIKGFASADYKVLQDRKEAIEYAIANSLPGDVVVIAGKGHEDYQIIGDKTYSFSDQNVARLALRNQEAKND